MNTEAAIEDLFRLLELEFEDEHFKKLARSFVRNMTTEANPKESVEPNEFKHVEVVVEEQTKTLRDDFAIAAMQGNWACESFEPYVCDEALEESANLYYRMADAMMKAREK